MAWRQASGRQASVGDRRLWADPSLIFSDTERIDLFDDPRWEIRPAEMAPAPERRSLRQAATRVLPFRRPGRGRHSIRRH